MTRISKVFCLLMEIGSPNIFSFFFFPRLIFSTREKIENFFTKVFVGCFRFFFLLKTLAQSMMKYIRVDGKKAGK